jgi:hypothetical protein
VAAVFDLGKFLTDIGVEKDNRRFAREKNSIGQS